MLHGAKKVIQKAANLFSYKITKISHVDPIIDNDEKFTRVYEKCKDYTMTSKERMYALYKAVEYIVNSKLPGDFVECGVWRGGSAMLMAHTLLQMGEADRKIYLYDTFEGMPEPTEVDYVVSDTRIRAVDRWKKDQKGDYNKWCFSPLPEVKGNMLSTGYPESNIIFVKGKVEDTIPETIPPQIALLRLDTDLYDSTKHELIHLFPLLTENGVLIIDDYGFWAGTKKAVDEYFADKPILLSRIDLAGRLGIKTR